jgi:hypothetical protein
LKHFPISILDVLNSVEPVIECRYGGFESHLHENSGVLDAWRRRDNGHRF